MLYFVLIQESQVLLTLTNPVENITHVSLYTCEEEDPDDINSNAKVKRHSHTQFGLQTEVVNLEWATPEEMMQSL